MIKDFILENFLNHIFFKMICMIKEKIFFPERALLDLTGVFVPAVKSLKNEINKTF